MRRESKSYTRKYLPITKEGSNEGNQGGKIYDV